MDAPKSAYQQVGGNLMRLSVGGFASAKLNFVAKFLKENGGSIHGYFENSDTIERKLQKLKTIFGLDQILCVNSGGSSVGFVGLVYSSLGRNRARHNLNTRLGSVKVNENGYEMVCLNDAGLNTKAEVIIVVEYAFQNNVSCLYSVMRSWYGYSDVTIETQCSDESVWTSRFSREFQPCKFDGYSALNPVGSAFAIAASGSSISIRCTGHNSEGDVITEETIGLLNPVTIFNVNKLNNPNDYWDGAGVPYKLVVWTSPMDYVLRRMIPHGQQDPWRAITAEGGTTEGGHVMADLYYTGEDLYTGGSSSTQKSALADMYNGGYKGGKGLPNGYYVVTKTTGIRIRQSGSKSLIYEFFKPKQRSHAVNSFYIDVTVFFAEAPHNIGDPIRYMMKITASWRIEGDGTNVPGAATVTIPAMDFSTTEGGSAVLVEGLEGNFPSGGITLTIPAGSTILNPTSVDSDMYYYDYDGSGWTGFVKARANASSSSTISGTVSASTSAIFSQLFNNINI